MKRSYSRKKQGASESKKITAETFVKHAKETFNVSRSTTLVEPHQLNEKQSKAFDIVESHAKNPGFQLKLIVSGQAGVGKSFFIHAVRSMLLKKRKQFRVLSFTGVASYLIHGSTIHRTLCLPYCYRNSSPWDNLKAARQMVRGVDYFIFDEMSMIGLHMFGYISERMKAIYQNEEDFGGKNIILTGDWGQVRPVGDKPLFCKDFSKLSGLEIVGAKAYAKFDKCVFLEQQMRQAAESEEVFRLLLSQIRKGEITDEGVEILNTRQVRNLTLEEKQEFLKEACLFAENAAADQYNMLRLQHLGTPVIEIKDKLSRGAPEGVEESLFLAMNSRIMLTKNLFVEASLYNGAMGTVTEIGPEWEDGRPSVVFVKFDIYIGPRYLLRDDIPIPMSPVSKYDSVTERSWTKTNFPLINAFAVTVHKSQGCTLRKVCIGLPDPCSRASMYYTQPPSLIFVAISRVKAIKDLALNRPFDPAVVTYAKGQYFIQWNEEEDRLREIEKRQ